MFSYQPSKPPKPHPLLCLITLTILILMLARANLPLSSTRAPQCPFGLVYVYHLPPLFNRHLIANACNHSSSHWLCGAASGFGPAADTAGILPPSLSSRWHSTSQFAAEIMYHERMLGRLDDPLIDWGSSLLNMARMQRVTRLVIERAPHDHHDIGVPYPTGFHPSSTDDVTQWQRFVRSRNRTRLFSFVGAARPDIKNDFRNLLINHCRNESDSCRLVDCMETDCSMGKLVNLETFLGSDFCLQPRGDSYTRRSVFDCMLAGSIPVFFWFRTAYDQYQWFLPKEPESYSVYINPRDIRNGVSIRSVLEGYSKEDVMRMRENVIECIPKFVYAKANGVRDAFDIAVEGVLKEFKEERGKRESIE